MKTLMILVLLFGVGLFATAGTTGPAERKAVRALGTEETSSLDAMVLKAVQPDYPREMLLSGDIGYVTLEATVNENGRVVAVRVVKSNQQKFTQAAIDALRKWQFVRSTGPTPEGERHIYVPFKFTLATS